MNRPNIEVSLPWSNQTLSTPTLTFSSTRTSFLCVVSGLISCIGLSSSVSKLKDSSNWTAFSGRWVSMTKKKLKVVTIYSIRSKKLCDYPLISSNSKIVKFWKAWIQKLPKKNNKTTTTKNLTYIHSTVFLQDISSGLTTSMVRPEYDTIVGIILTPLWYTFDKPWTTKKLKKVQFDTLFIRVFFKLLPEGVIFTFLPFHD